VHRPSRLDAAREALRLADASPAEAMALASATVRRARRQGDTVARAVAERAWGQALRHRGDLDRALAHLQRSLRCAEEAGDAATAAEARLTVAFLLAERGRAGQALDELDRVVGTLDDPRGRARALAQRGGVLLDLGRHGEALDHYREALPVLRAAGDTFWVRRVIWNRGLAHAFRHEFAPAEADLRLAERLAREESLPLEVGFAQANLAFVLGLRGETAAAFAWSATAERRIREQHGRLGELLVDRADLLLSVRLVGEAREAAEQAVAEYARGRRGMKLPQARLVLAEAALLDGDAAAALPHARRAAREFGRQHRPEWAALARLLVLRATCPDGRARAADVRAALDVTHTLTAARWPSSALDARILTATLLRRRGQAAEAAAHLREAARARTGGPAMLRARGWYAEALARDDAGNPRGARAAIRAGLRLLDEHRAVLGATDVRAHAAGHRTALAELGLRIALRSGRPREVLEWTERGRATGLLMHRSGRPPDDPETAEALAALRSIVREVNDLHGAGRGEEAGPLLARQAAVERRIRERSLRRGGAVDTLAPPAGVDALAAGLGDAGLLELVDADGVLIAITVAAGRVRLRRIGPTRTADDLLDRVAFAVSRLLRPDLPAALHTAAAQLLRESAARADDALLRRMPELADRPLVVVPTGSLQNVPWALLPSCAGRPVTVSPSATLWLGARSRPVEPGHVLVAAGPELPGADAEARAVAAVHGVDPVLAADATAERVLAALDGAALAHLATHGRLAPHNPLFSELTLADGPLFAYDVEQLPAAPHTVVLAACESGRSVVCAGDELLGLGAMFLARGSSQLVASPLPVPDSETAPLMTAFHRRVAAGRPVAEALADAQEQMRGTGVAELTTGCFVCVGSGFGQAPLVPPPHRHPSPTIGPAPVSASAPPPPPPRRPRRPPPR
jgi:tetratricopeptide (TPR) repeat protein